MPSPTIKNCSFLIKVHLAVDCRLPMSCPLFFLPSFKWFGNISDCTRARYTVFTRGATHVANISLLFVSTRIIAYI